MTANVSNLKLVGGDKQITATWTYGGTGANAVEVKWRPSGQGAWRQAQRLELSPSQTQTTITGLVDGQAYDVQVVPVQYASKSATATGTPVAPVPPPPTTTVVRFHRCGNDYSGADFSPTTIAADAPRRVLVSCQGTVNGGRPPYKPTNPACVNLLAKTGIWVDSANGQPATDPSNVSGVSFTSATANGWLLSNAAGAQVFNSGDSSFLLGDLGSPGYQALWATNVIAECHAGGYDGVWCDEMSFWYKTDMANGPAAKYASPTAWRAAVTAFLTSVGPAVRSAGLMIIPNVTSAASDPAERNALLVDVDGTFEEGWMRDRVDHSQPVNSLADGLFAPMLQEAIDSEKTGKWFLAELPASIDDLVAIRYALCSLLLVANGRSSFDISATNSPSSGKTYCEAFWCNDYDQALALGAPTGDHVTLNAGNVYRRDFEHGTVLVNPSAAAQTVTVGSQTLALQPLTGALV